MIDGKKLVGLFAGLFVLMLIPRLIGDEFEALFPQVPVNFLAGFAVGGMVFYIFQSDD